MLFQNPNIVKDELTELSMEIFACSNEQLLKKWVTLKTVSLLIILFRE